MAHPLRAKKPAAEGPPPVRNVLVFGAHKVGTRSMFASFEHTKGVKPGRTHNPGDFAGRKLGPGDVVLVGIRDPKKLKLSAYFHSLGSRHHKDVALDKLTPQEVFEHYCGFNCAKAGMPVNIDVYMRAVAERFQLDFREMDWGSPTAPFLHRVARSSKVHVVVYQLEKMSQETLDAICKATGLPRVKMARVNVGDDKPYAELYKAVKQLDAGRPETSAPEWYTRIFCQ